MIIETDFYRVSYFTTEDNIPSIAVQLECTADLGWRMLSYSDKDQDRGESNKPEVWNMHINHHLGGSNPPAPAQRRLLTPYSSTTLCFLVCISFPPSGSAKCSVCFSCRVSSVVLMSYCFVTVGPAPNSQIQWPRNRQFGLTQPRHFTDMDPLSTHHM